MGLVIIGAAIGIGWLTRSAVESMARQPEIAGNIQTAMIISAALIEGVTFFALILIGVHHHRAERLRRGRGAAGVAAASRARRPCQD